MRKLIFMSYCHRFLFLTLFNDKITWITLAVLKKKIAPLKNSVHCRKTGEKSRVCNDHRKRKAWHLPPPFFFPLEGSLQMEKSSPIASLSETEYDEKTEEGQAPKQAEPRAASVLARSPRRLINPE